MKPINFPEQTDVLGKPQDMTDEECTPLPVFRNGQQCVSCWQLSDEEIIQLIQNDGKLYLSVLSGWTQPPVWLAVENPFLPLNE